jgi:hypothetical protein
LNQSSQFFQKRKVLVFLLHTISISPLALTLGFVALHFDNFKQSALFFSIFVLLSLAFPPLLQKIVSLGPTVEVTPEHVAYVDKDPGRMIPIYVLPFVVFANTKTEDVLLILFLAGLIGYIMSGPLSLQTHPVFWFKNWRLYNVTIIGTPNSLVFPGKMSFFVLTNKKINQMAEPLRVVRLSPAFFIDMGMFYKIFSSGKFPA